MPSTRSRAGDVRFTPESGQTEHVCCLSALCQKRTSPKSFDHLVGAADTRFPRCRAP